MMKITNSVGTFKTKQQMGLSILEAMLIILAVGVIILSTVMYFRQAEYQTQKVEFLAEMKGVVQAAVQYNQIHNSFNGLSVEEIVKMNTIVPRYNIVLTGGSGGSRLPVPWTGSVQSTYIPGIMVHKTSQAYACFKIQRIKSSICQPVLEQLVQFMDIKMTQSTITAFCQSYGGGTVYLSYPKREDGYPVSC